MPAARRRAAPIPALPPHLEAALGVIEAVQSLGRARRRRRDPRDAGPPPDRARGCERMPGVAHRHRGRDRPRPRRTRAPATRVAAGGRGVRARGLPADGGGGRDGRPVRVLARDRAAGLGRERAPARTGVPRPPDAPAPRRRRAVRADRDLRRAPADVRAGRDPALPGARHRGGEGRVAGAHGRAPRGGVLLDAGSARGGARGEGRLHIGSCAPHRRARRGGVRAARHPPGRSRASCGSLRCSTTSARSASPR